MDDVLDRTRGGVFAALPATRREVEPVSKLFGKRATVLLGSVASEQQTDELGEAEELETATMASAVNGGGKHLLSGASECLTSSGTFQVSLAAIRQGPALASTAKLQET